MYAIADPMLGQQTQLRSLTLICTPETLAEAF